MVNSAYVGLQLIYNWIADWGLLLVTGGLTELCTSYIKQEYFMMKW